MANYRWTRTSRMICFAALISIGVTRALEIRRETAFVGYSERPGSAEERLESAEDERNRIAQGLLQEQGMGWKNPMSSAKPAKPNPSCHDDDLGCEDWARKGECERNSFFMHATCRLACEQCNPQIEVSEFEGSNVDFVTQLGRISITLLWDSAPEMCALVVELANSNGHAGSRFYRNEAVPKDGVGPPYALLQGVMSQLSKQPPREETTTIKRGHIATIHPEKDFYIALGGHEDWSAAHTAWGLIEDLSTVEAIVESPFTESIHAANVTIMRMLVDPVPFTVEVATTPQ